MEPVSREYQCERVNDHDTRNAHTAHLRGEDGNVLILTGDVAWVALQRDRQYKISIEDVTSITA